MNSDAVFTGFSDDNHPIQNRERTRNHESKDVFSTGTCRVDSGPAAVLAAVELVAVSAVTCGRAGMCRWV